MVKRLLAAGAGGQWRKQPARRLSRRSVRLAVCDPEGVRTASRASWSGGAGVEHALQGGLL